MAHMRRDDDQLTGTPDRRRRPRVRAGVALAAAVAVAASLVSIAPGAVQAQEAPDALEAAPFTRGSFGIGDPYFPMDGNGGYNVTHYGLELAYDPATDVLEGVATIDLRATQNLSRFNVDLDGLLVESVTVDGDPATFTRKNGELKITPPGGLPVRTHAQVVVTYEGDPAALPPEDGSGGFISTDDGVLVVGQPHVASTWFPANDHPKDKAAFDIAVTVPDGLEVVSNGSLVSQVPEAGGTRWVWHAPSPMAPYLATLAIGEFELSEYHDPGGRPDGIDYLDAVDPDLYEYVAPPTGTQYAYSQAGQTTFKRLRRTITVPAEGAELSFAINRDTEQNWDYVFVEARTAGQQDWTTLPDENGHTTDETGFSCPYWLGLHPFLSRYQRALPNGSCSPTGSSGEWNAISGMGDGWEQWTVDLGAFAGSNAQVSISYASDDSVQTPGVFVDDIVVSTGEGSTSFEADGDVMDGWTVPGPPASSEPNVNDWIVGTVDDAPDPFGVAIDASLSRQPEINTFLADTFGDYPFADSGAIVDDLRGLGFALENQTRPVYAPEFFDGSQGGDSVVVHELAHQWFGDRLALPAWKHIWLNEGFATYAEWLWAEHDGVASAQTIFDDFYAIPGNHPLWQVKVADPGPNALFDNAVYYRGAMTLHALRLEVGDADFFEIARQWAASPPTRLSTTRNFTALAESVSGEQLDDLFHRWLRTTTKPALSETAAESTGVGSGTDPLPTRDPRAR